MLGAGAGYGLIFSWQVRAQPRQGRAGERFARVAALLVLIAATGAIVEIIRSWLGGAAGHG